MVGRAWDPQLDNPTLAILSALTGIRVRHLQPSLLFTKHGCKRVYVVKIPWTEVIAESKVQKREEEERGYYGMRRMPSRPAAV